MNSFSTTEILENLDVKDLIELEDFLASYAYELDDTNIEAWVDFFDSNGIYQLTTSYNESSKLPLGIIYCKGHGMMIDRVSALLTANIFEKHKYTHIFTKPRAKKLGEKIYCRSNFVIYRTMESGLSEVFATGKYSDQIIKSDNELKFLERRAIIDSKRIDTLIVYPI
jgi:3-phenylpropionate/cinnamic acid dioxygenase small subunit